MVSLDVYEVYAQHHRQDLEQAANVSRYLKSRKGSSRKDFSSSPAFLVRMLRKLSAGSPQDSRTAVPTVKDEGSLTAG